jgi:hypothetical protein
MKFVPRCIIEVDHLLCTGTDTNEAMSTSTPESLVAIAIPIDQPYGKSTLPTIVPTAVPRPGIRIWMRRSRATNIFTASRSPVGKITMVT